MMDRSRFAWLAGLLAGSLAWAFAAPAAAQDKPTPAQLEAGCDAGDLDSCHKLGFALVTGDGIDQDMARAATLFSDNCDKGWARSCRNSGVMAARGDAMPQDDRKAFGYFARGCDLGDAQSCHQIADQYYTGTGVEQDFARAAEFGSAACDDGIGGACRLVGFLYLDGQMGDADPVERFALYRRGCDLDDGPSCAILGEAHYFGTDMAQDYPLALTLYERACDNGVASACRNLGVMHQTGQGTTSSRVRALSYYARGCEGGDEDSCSVLAVTRENCTSAWFDFVTGEEFGPDMPKILTVRAEIGGDPRALFESGVAGRGVMLVEAQQPYAEGDEKSRADRLKPGEGAILTWPGHDTAYYVESSQRLTSVDQASGYLDRMCSFSDQAVLVQTVSSFIILSEVEVPIDPAD